MWFPTGHLQQPPDSPLSSSVFWHFMNFFLLIPDYSFWATDLVWPHQSSDWLCLMFLILSGCLLSIQGHLKLDLTLLSNFMSHFTLWQTNHSLALGSALQFSFSRTTWFCLLCLFLPISSCLNPAHWRPSSKIHAASSRKSSFMLPDGHILTPISAFL